MIVVAILEGYSASSRSRTIIDVFEETKDAMVGLDDEPIVVLGEKSSILRSRSRKMRRFISDHAHPDSKLLLIGKSYGAKQMINRVVNKLKMEVFQEFASTYLVTVDPCWPTWTDWTPNLNNRTLQVNKPFTRMRNIMLMAPKRVQAGCRIQYPLMLLPEGEKAPDQVNFIAGKPYTHFSIIEHPQAKTEIGASLSLASQG